MEGREVGKTNFKIANFIYKSPQIAPRLETIMYVFAYICRHQRVSEREEDDACDCRKEE